MRWSRDLKLWIWWLHRSIDKYLGAYHSTNESRCQGTNLDASRGCSPQSSDSADCGLSDSYFEKLGNCQPKSGSLVFSPSSLEGSKGAKTVLKGKKGFFFLKKEWLKGFFFKLGKLEIYFEEVAQSLEPPWRWIGCHQHVHGTLDDTVLPCQFFQHFVECEIMWQRGSLVKIGIFQILRRNQHILIRLSTFHVFDHLTSTQPWPFFRLTLSITPPDSSNLARTKLQGLKDWQQKKKGNLSSWIWENCTCHSDLLFQETHGAENKDLDLLHASGNEAQLAQVSEIEGICTK